MFPSQSKPQLDDGNRKQSMVATLVAFNLFPDVNVDQLKNGQVKKTQLVASGVKVECGFAILFPT